MDQTISETGKRRKKVLSDSQKEKSYGNVMKLIESTGCILQYELMVYVYDVIIKRLKRLGEYKDSVELLEQYTTKRQEYVEKGTEQIYQSMLEKKTKVTKAEDIQWVLKEANRIPDYKDVQEVIAWCDDTFASMQKKEQVRATIRISVLAVVIVALIIVFTSIKF